MKGRNRTRDCVYTTTTSNHCTVNNISIFLVFFSLLNSGLEQAKKKYQAKVRRLEQRLLEHLVETKTDNNGGLSSRCSSAKSCKSEKQIC